MTVTSPDPIRPGQRPPVSPSTLRASWSDDEVLLHIRSGDPSAFAELYRRFERDARRFARTLVAADDVDDLVSESFAKMLRAIDNGHGPVDGPARYLMVTVRTTAASLHRRRAQSTEVVDRIANQPVAPEAPFAVEDPNLLAAFRSLQARWRQVIWWTEIEGMHPAEVAERLAITPPAASALAYRARRALREAYAASVAASAEAEQG